MIERPYWRVVVSINGDEVLSIAPDELAGISDIDTYREQILAAADHLVAFIGRTDPEPFVLYDGITAPQSSTLPPLPAAPYPDEQQLPYSGPEPGPSDEPARGR